MGLKHLEAGLDLNMLAISGIALATIQNEDKIMSSLLLLMRSAKTTIFVRMAPSQKVQVIEIAKRDLMLKTLAIGDGYND